MSLDTGTLAEFRVKRAQFVSRIFMVLVIINVICSVILVMTMYQMGSRLTVLSQVFDTTIRGTDTMFYPQALNPGVDNIHSLEWAFVQRWIEEKKFVIPDKYEMLRRWDPYGNLASMSLNSEKAFVPIYKNSDDKIKEALESRPQHAENIRYVSDINHHWTLEFDECVQMPLESVCVHKKANVVVGFAPWLETANYFEGLYFNPFGMIVTEYHEF